MAGNVNLMILLFINYFYLYTIYSVLFGHQIQQHKKAVCAADNNCRVCCSLNNLFESLPMRTLFCVSYFWGARTRVYVCVCALFSSRSHLLSPCWRACLVTSSKAKLRLGNLDSVYPKKNVAAKLFSFIFAIVCPRACALVLLTPAVWTTNYTAFRTDEFCFILFLLIRRSRI